MTKLTPRHKADIEEFSKTLPVYKERESLQNEMNRRTKWGNLSKDQIESFTNSAQSFDEYKSLVVELGVATEEELEDAQTPRELRLLLKGRAVKLAPKPQTEAGSKDGDKNPFFSQFDAWAKARGIAVPANGVKPDDGPIQLPGSGRAAQRQTYKELISSKASPAEIDAANAAWLAAQGR